MKIDLDTYIISDTHFGQDSILLKEPMRKNLAKNLGYKNHFDLLVDNWNKIIKDDDKVLHLGDVYFNGGMSYIKKLNGRKRLIIGNNDVKRFKYLSDLGWQVKNKMILKIPQKDKIRQMIKKKFGAEDEFVNGIVLDIAGHRILFSHFPVFDRKPHDRFAFARDIIDEYYRLCDCSLNIHGHTHSRNTKHPFCINLSCEQTRLSPVALKEIL